MLLTNRTINPTPTQIILQRFRQNKPNKLFLLLIVPVVVLVVYSTRIRLVVKNQCVDQAALVHIATDKLLNTIQTAIATVMKTFNLKQTKFNCCSRRCRPTSNSRYHLQQQQYRHIASQVLKTREQSPKEVKKHFRFSFFGLLCDFMYLTLQPTNQPANDAP
uniref:Transmembrane protein n=1 Tax=Glossina brevipalpis TaxID=37001 RepID=A0A1A9WIF1_9MUSC